MRVMHINSNYGRDLFYRDLYDLQSQSHRLLVVVPSRLPGQVRPSSHGPYSVEIPLGRTQNPLMFKRNYGRAYGFVSQLISQEPPDLVHAHTLFSNGVLAYWAHRQFGIPYVVAVRDTDLRIFVKYAPMLVPLGRRILGSAARIIFLSKSFRDATMQRLVEAGDRNRLLSRSHVIPNGVSPYWLDNPGLPRSFSATGDLRFLLVGAISARKNPLGAAHRIANELRMSSRAWSLTVMGKTPWSPNPIVTRWARQIERRLKNTSHVVLTQHGSPDEVRHAMQSADIFILLSKYETFGRVYLEALSQGLPVLYTKGQGFDGLYPDGDIGFPVDLKVGNDLGGAVDRIISDYDAMSARCLARAQAAGWGAIKQQYDEIYRLVV